MMNVDWGLGGEETPFSERENRGLLAFLKYQLFFKSLHQRDTQGTP